MNQFKKCTHLKKTLKKLKTYNFCETAIPCMQPDTLQIAGSKCTILNCLFYNVVSPKIKFKKTLKDL